MQAGRRTKHSGQNYISECHFLKILNFPPGPRTSRTSCTSRRSQGPEPRGWIPASARGDGRGRCRGHIAGAQDKVSAGGNPRATLQGNPECSLGLLIL
ncbi:unnamed protein product, partial [Staurois parvus]